MNKHMDVTAETVNKKDKGFTLVELLIVIVILGILSTVTVFAVRGLTDKSKTTACATDKATYQVAAEAYLGLYPNETLIATQAMPAIAAVTGVSVARAAITAVPAPSGVTQGATPADTLVNVKLLKTTSSIISMGPDGKIYSAAAQCGLIGTVL